MSYLRQLGLMRRVSAAPQVRKQVQPGAASLPVLMTCPASFDGCHVNVDPANVVPLALTAAALRPAEWQWPALQYAQRIDLRGSGAESAL